MAATREQIANALKAAHAAGNAEHAAKLAAALRAMPATPAAAPAPQFSDLPGNILPSAGQLLIDMTAPIHSPIETFQGLKAIATSPEARAAVADFYKQRYGGVENLKNTLIKDPVGALSDVASVLTLGGGLASKLPGMAGKVGSVVAKTGDIVDPVANTGRALRLAGRGIDKLASPALGTTTMEGTKAIRATADAGYRGDTKFWDNFTGKVDQTAVLDDVDAALNSIKHQAQERYRADFPTYGDPIDTSQVHTKLSEFLRDVKTPEGYLKISEADYDSVQAMMNEVKKRMGKEIDVQPPSMAHETGTTMTAPGERVVFDHRTPLGNTPEGRYQKVVVPKEVDIFELDGLKQYLRQTHGGNESPQVKRALKETTDAIAAVIATKHPEYAGIMDRYSDAQDLLRDIRKSMSLTDKTGADTKIAALTRTLHDTPKGQRTAGLLDEMNPESARQIRAQLAGQRMSRFLPGGGRLLPRIAGETMAGGLAYLAGSSLGNPALAVPLMAMTSPMLVGGTIYGGARAAGAVDRAWTRAGMPAPKVLGRTFVQVSRPAEVARDELEELQSERAEGALQ